jgi:integrase/recombinase XerD
MTIRSDGMKKHNRHNRRVGTTALSDPLGDYPSKFRSHLESQHYSPATIAGYGRRIAALGGLMRELQIDTGSLNERSAERLIGRLQPHSYRKSWTAFVVKRFVRYLIEQGATTSLPPGPNDTARERLRQEYEDYLRNQRGLSESTIYHCWRFADRFLQFRFSGKGDDLSKLTPLDIAKFMLESTSRHQTFRGKTLPTYMRNFFRFLFRSGKTNLNLAPSVPRIVRKYASALPRYLSPEQVETLVEAVKTDTATGRRNYAMVLLLARLGLRAAEVIAMRIDDIDWRAGEILVRGKGQRHDRMPLPKDVGEALANYIRQDRTTASRALFVTQRAPRVAFADAQIINAALQDAFEKTHLKPPTQYIGSHILRHSLATNMVRQGASLAEIGDVLRHRSHRSTMIYAKLDIEGLRSIAPAWPGARGAK